MPALGQRGSLTRTAQLPSCILEYRNRLFWLRQSRGDQRVRSLHRFAPGQSAAAGDRVSAFPGLSGVLRSRRLGVSCAAACVGSAGLPGNGQWMMGRGIAAAAQSTDDRGRAGPSGGISDSGTIAGQGHLNFPQRTVRLRGCGRGLPVSRMAPSVTAGRPCPASVVRHQYAVLLLP